MDYVIDIQGVRDKENKFIPKEVTFVSLLGQVSGHWIVSPPYPYNELTCDLKTTNDYILKNLNIQWFDGDISIRKLLYHFSNLAREASRIYVKGAEQARYVEKKIARSVINIDDYTTTASYCELKRKFSCEKKVCFHHAFQAQKHRCDDFQDTCSLRRVNLIKNWLLSLLPESCVITSKSSEIIYQALHNFIFNRPAMIRFAGSSRDTVDVALNLTDEETTRANSGSLIYESAPDEIDASTPLKQDEHEGDNEGFRRITRRSGRRLRC